MTTHEYLSQLKSFQEKIEDAIGQIASLESAACSMSAPPTDREKVQTSMKGDKISNTVAKIIDIERENYLNYSFKRKEIISQIEEVEEPKREVLLKRYSLGMRTIDIANKMHMTERHIGRLLSQGQNEFEKKYGWLYLHLSS